MANNILLTNYSLNKLLTLKNRVVMAPMTRVSADNELAPTAAMAEYYARRAEAGLIVTEGTVISSDAHGHKNVPGIFTANQIAKWQQVTQAVHQRDGLIFSQIWHVGRVSHPEFLQGKLPISASATKMSGRISRSPHLTFGESRAATLAEINNIISQYAKAAQNAIAAGFDGVEIHGANGYLIDQFLHYQTNLRNDEYGGSIENMARFALEVVKACGEAIGYDRVGLRLSPAGYLNEIMSDYRDAALFKYLLQELNNLSLAYVHTGNFNDEKIFPELHNQTMSAFIRSIYQGNLIASGSYSIERAQQGIMNNEFDLIAMGRPFIANPDLLTRIAQKEALKSYDVSMLNTLY